MACCIDATTIKSQSYQPYAIDALHINPHVPRCNRFQTQNILGKKNKPVASRLLRYLPTFLSKFSRSVIQGGIAYKDLTFFPPEQRHSIELENMLRSHFPMIANPHIQNFYSRAGIFSYRRYEKKAIDDQENDLPPNSCVRRDEKFWKKSRV